MPHGKPSEPFLWPIIFYDTFSLDSYSQYNDLKGDFLRFPYPELISPLSYPKFKIFYPHQKGFRRPIKLIKT